MSEYQPAVGDMELLSAGIYVEPQTLSGPAGISHLTVKVGEHVLWQGGAWREVILIQGKNQLAFYLELYDLLSAACPGSHSVLMIGAGGCSYPRYLVAHHPEVSLRCTEIDPKIAALACSHFCG